MDGGEAAHLMDSSGGWVISKTNFSTGRCSLSKITTTTFSTSFCKDRYPLLQNWVPHTHKTPSYAREDGIAKGALTSLLSLKAKDL